MKTIALRDCKKGSVYWVEARNFKLAVFDGEVFVGIREKFGTKFLDSERHWDEEDTERRVMGSCKPIREVGFVPDGVLDTKYVSENGRLSHNDVLFEYLSGISKIGSQ